MHVHFWIKVEPKPHSMPRKWQCKACGAQRETKGLAYPEQDNVIRFMGELIAAPRAEPVSKDVQSLLS